jgi:hypothetical protein
MRRARLLEMLNCNLVHKKVCASVEMRYWTGEEVLYTWVEFLREHTELWEPPSAPGQDTCPADELGSQPREGELDEGEGSDSAEEGWEEGQAAGSAADRFARWQRTSGPGGLASIACPEIVHGEPFTERKSTFQVRALLEVPCSNPAHASKQLLVEGSSRDKMTHNLVYPKDWVPIRCTIRLLPPVMYFLLRSKSSAP